MPSYLDLVACSLMVCNDPKSHFHYQVTLQPVLFARKL